MLEPLRPFRYPGLATFHPHDAGTPHPPQRCREPSRCFNCVFQVCTHPGSARMSRLKGRNKKKISFYRKAKWCSLSAGMSHTHPLTTTTFELPGYRVVKTFGVVRGIVVRSRSIVGNFGAHLQSLLGGNISLYTSLCERTREEAFYQMITHAGELGANAVVGVRYDATEIGAGITEVLCYGTAAFVEQAG